MHADDTVDQQAAMQQRIAERRAVLDAKLKARRAAEAGADAAAQALKEQQEKAEAERRLLAGPGADQVARSRRELAALKAAALDAISGFRINADAAENERRQAEEVLALARRQRVADDADNTRRAQGSIQMQFDNLFDRSAAVAQELHTDLRLQKEACARVIDVKDKLAQELRLQLRDKEELYVRALKGQAEDIDRLIETMHAQTQQLVQAYGREQRACEAAFAQERQQLLDAHEAEINQLVSQRATKERDHQRRYEQRVWDDQRALDEKYEENAEKFNLSKMENLRDIHGLAEELELIRAKYLRNAEKLSYNLQVLRERVKENKRASELHRKKLGRLQDVLSTLIARYAEADRRFRQVNAELTEGFRRVTAQYKDLQTKFQHFEKADKDKRAQLWRMHEEECGTRVQACLQGDRVIFEEVLGVAWAAPDLDFWDAAGEAAEERRRQLAEAAQREADGTGAAGATGAAERIELSEGAEAMLAVLYSQLPFLVDERVRALVAELEGSEDTAHIKCDAVLQALGITVTAEVRQMLEYMTVRTEDGEPALINPQEALRALQQFLIDRREQQQRQRREAQQREGAGASAANGVAMPRLDLSAGGSPNGGGGAGASMKLGATSSEAAEARKARALEVHQRLKERNFWRRMAAVIPEQNRRTWATAEDALTKYHKQLQLRQTLIDETDTIRKQNDELRGLLNQYLSSDLNRELFSPPQLQVIQTGSQ
jgi:dynein regulatory complex protein 1